MGGLLIGPCYGFVPSKNCCSKANDVNECNAMSTYTYPLVCNGCGYSGKCVGGIDPQTCQVSCPPGNNPQGCAFDNCVGGTGVDCDGVSQDLDFGPLGVLTVNLVKPIDNGDGTVTLKVSVGSIYHDLCCRDYPHGAFCDSSNYPIDQTINLLGNADQNCACLLHWRKAAWNLLRGRYWLARFPKAPHTSDLTPVSTTRRTWMPTGSGTNYISYRDNFGITEVKETSKLCAPSNTELDCPSEDDNCKVPCFGVTCTACSFGCTSSQRKRWNKNGRNHATAGDAEWCCSKRFKKVYWSLEGTRYGVCE